MKHLRSLLGLAVVALAGTHFAAAQVTLSGTQYTQNFNDLASGLPTGWTVRTNASAGNLGTAASFTTTHKDWGSSAGGFGNYASTSDGVTPFTGAELTGTQSASTNRSLGVRQTGTFGDPGAAFVLQLQNTLGFGNFQLNLDLNMLFVTNRSTTWTIDYAVGNTPGAFTSVGTYTDPGVFGATNRTFGFGGALDNQAENVWIRIVALTASTGSNARDTFGIDNVRLTFEPASQNLPPTITTHPQSRTNNANTTATFTVAVTGTAPFNFQWRRNGANLSDGPTASGSTIVGATLQTLTLSNVFGGDIGNYSVVVNNGFGTATSSAATLTVLDPVITFQPGNRTNLVGDTGTFRATAAGTELSYQWRFNGVDISGATTNVLGVEDLQLDDAGNYSLVVSNVFGAVTSSTASLTVLPRPPLHIARWDFNSNPPDGNGTTGETTPIIGTGSSAPVGGITQSFAAGTDSDPAAITGDNTGWQTTTYPAQNTGNKTRGVQFNVSTSGRQDILVAWEQRHSNTASKYARFQYSTNGTDFVDHNVIVMTATNNSFVLFTNNLAGVEGVSNNPNFAFRIVTEFESTATGAGADSYIATTPGNSYGTSGTVRFDWVNVYGNNLGTTTQVSLSITPVGNNLQISWPSSATDFVLESTTGFSPANWQLVSQTPTPNGPNNVVIISPTGNEFFRLRKTN